MDSTSSGACFIGVDEKLEPGPAIYRSFLLCLSFNRQSFAYEIMLEDGNYLDQRMLQEIRKVYYEERGFLSRFSFRGLTGIRLGDAMVMIQDPGRTNRRPRYLARWQSWQDRRSHENMTPEEKNRQRALENELESLSQYYFHNPLCMTDQEDFSWLYNDSLVRSGVIQDFLGIDGNKRCWRNCILAEEGLMKQRIQVAISFTIAMVIVVGIFARLISRDWNITFSAAALVVAISAAVAAFLNIQYPPYYE